MERLRKNWDRHLRDERLFQGFGGSRSEPVLFYHNLGAFEGKLKPSSDDSRHGQVFVQIFPTQRRSGKRTELERIMSRLEK
jgi:hypothetical protein